MNEKLIKQFETLYQLQETMAELTTKNLYDELGTTETHCIQFIGISEAANGVMIVDHLNLTRSAISKLTSRLEKSGYIKGYKKPDNKKEVFYKLTKKGKDIFKRHQRAHQKWIERDSRFLDTLDQSDLEVMSRVLDKFNEYIQNEIKGRIK